LRFSKAGLAATDEIYDFDQVPRPQDRSVPFCLRDYGAIDFDRYPGARQLEPLDKGEEPRVTGDLVRLTVELDFDITGWSRGH
jgi:hypothetical protein